MESRFSMFILCFTVVAVFSLVESRWDDEIDIGPPTNVKVVRYSAEIVNVTWDYPDDFSDFNKRWSSYVVKYHEKGDNDPKSAYTIITPSGSLYLDTHVDPEVTYVFKIRATTNDGFGEWSDEVTLPKLSKRMIQMLQWLNL